MGRAGERIDRPRLMTYGTVDELCKLTREICKRCLRESPVGFTVPDEIWRRGADHWADDILCITCFAYEADVRNVRWDLVIEFFPVSRVTFEERATRAAIAPERIASIVIDKAIKERARDRFEVLEEAARIADEEAMRSVKPNGRAALKARVIAKKIRLRAEEIRLRAEEGTW